MNSLINDKGVCGTASVTTGPLKIAWYAGKYLGPFDYCLWYPGDPPNTSSYAPALYLSMLFISYIYQTFIADCFFLSLYALSVVSYIVLLLV